MKVGLFFGSFASGGAERMMINLAKGLHNKGVDVTIYVANKTGPYLKEVPNHIDIYSYEAKFGVKSVIHKIRDTLKKDGLSAFISTQMHINAMVGLAAVGLINKPKIIFREPNTSSVQNHPAWLHTLYKITYSVADAYVAISKGVKDDLLNRYSLSPEDIEVIYNPVIDELVKKKSNNNPSHKWLSENNSKVIIGMGRIMPQKDFPTLLKAFSLVRDEIDSKLIIFGGKRDQDYYEFIEKTVKNLRLTEFVDIPGFVSNPYAQFTNADLFVQSPIYEGLGNVLIEAMACGCPVVSTDCPSGPREILEDGKYGPLVEVGDYKGLAEAMLSTLKEPIDRKKLQKRGKFFSVENATDQYLELMKNAIA